MPKRRAHGDGGLYYLPSRELWRGVVELPERDGKRRQKYVHARTQRECKRKLDALKDEIRANGGVPLQKGVRFEEWADRWFEEYGRPDLDPKTFATYRSLIKNWATPVIGRRPVSEVKPSDITRIHRGILAAGRSTSTARQTHIVLDRIFEQARREPLCARNVVDDVDRPGKKRDAKKYKAVAERDALDDAYIVKLLRAAAKRKNGSMWWFKLLTGQRQSEILGAVLEDLDLPDDEATTGFYEVNWKLEELTSDHGCGEQDEAGSWPCGKKRGGSCTHRTFRVPDDFAMRHLVGRLHLTEPKSQTGKRVPLVSALADIMRRDIAYMSDKPNPHGLIWRHDDGSPILPAEDAAGWRDLLHEVGLIADAELKPGASELTGHIARHTTVTALYALGVDAHLIGEIVGQSTQRVTESYRHVRDAERLDALQQYADTVLSDIELPELPTTS